MPIKHALGLDWQPQLAGDWEWFVFILLVSLKWLIVEEKDGFEFFLLVFAFYLVERPVFEAAFSFFEADRRGNEERIFIAEAVEKLVRLKEGLGRFAKKFLWGLVFVYVVFDFFNYQWNHLCFVLHFLGWSIVCYPVWYPYFALIPHKTNHLVADLHVPEPPYQLLNHHEDHFQYVKALYKRQILHLFQEELLSFVVYHHFRPAFGGCGGDGENFEEGVGGGASPVDDLLFVRGDGMERGWDGVGEGEMAGHREKVMNKNIKDGLCSVFWFWSNFRFMVQNTNEYLRRCLIFLFIIL